MHHYTGGEEGFYVLLTHLDTSTQHYKTSVAETLPRDFSRSIDHTFLVVSLIWLIKSVESALMHS